MILTVTPNPSLDRTYEVPALDRGEVLRATAERMDPGGKGVNVSRAVAAAGRATIAVLPLGGAPGALVAELLAEQGIEVVPVPVAGATRSNIALAEPDGTLTKINAPGPELTAAESEALLSTIRERIHATARGSDASVADASVADASGADASGTAAEPSDQPDQPEPPDQSEPPESSDQSEPSAPTWIACCGSLPRGLAPEWYAELVARAHRAGARIALDTSGPSLLAALRERPDVVKPNAEELAEAVGRPLTTVGDAVKAAEELRTYGAGSVLASLGADGQLLVSAAGTYFGSATVATVRSNVGAGDASLAGFLAAGGEGPAALASAVAHGAAAVQLPGSVMPSPGDLDLSAVTVTADVPLDRPLTEPAP
ncbi:1-phosphofructokinase family hexose kinase [Streptomyces corynorhini]|uniref:1-phosphofructokinase family hexose kinase n=1 Tax=Streptomyces corynorhini TaxID=2282652 RepID=A0A370B524_9ACTN|nr:1-phosphofructokinase family hexose kinase [Streptomyces corynorhini]RDG36918.1 1-phosphofructokinase family hexose kinase [Streptomyces corynorhini]